MIIHSYNSKQNLGQEYVVFEIKETLRIKSIITFICCKYQEKLSWFRINFTAVDILLGKVFLPWSKFEIKDAATLSTSFSVNTNPLFLSRIKIRFKAKVRYLNCPRCVSTQLTRCPVLNLWSDHCYDLSFPRILQADTFPYPRNQ